MIQMMPTPFNQPPTYNVVKAVLSLCLFNHRSLLKIIFSARSSARTGTGTRFAAAIAAEKLDEFGDPDELYSRRPGQPRNYPSIAKRKRTAIDNTDTDADDDNFAASSTDDGSGDDDNITGMIISNEEVKKKYIYYPLKIVDFSQVADMLPSKTIPEVNNGKKLMRKPTRKAKVSATVTVPPKKKVRVRSVEVEEIEDEDSTRNITARNSSISQTSSFEIPNIKKVDFFNVVLPFHIFHSYF